MAMENYLEKFSGERAILILGNDETFYAQ